MKTRRIFSLRYKIFIFSLLMTVVPILVVGTLSYIVSTNIVRGQASNLNMETLKQIAYNIDFIVSDVRGISLNMINNDQLNRYLKSMDHNYRAQNDPAIHVELSSYILTKKYIYSIYVQNQSGMGLDTQGLRNEIADAQMTALNRLNGKELWDLSDVYIGPSNVKVIALFRQIRDTNNLHQVLGYLKINLSEPQIRRIYDKEIIDGQGLFFMIDENRTILSTHSDQAIGQSLNAQYTQPQIFEEREGYYDAVINGKKYLVEYYTIDSTGWKLIHYVPIQWITGSSERIKQVMFFSVCISLVICCLFLLFFMMRVLKPLKEIRRLMGALENENFNVTMNVQGNDEIALLAGSFNKMSGKLNELINEVHVVKIRQKEAEIKALEEQINPHFLYNTLDLIYWMGRMEKAFETASMIQTLSRLFRIGLNKGSGFTKVRKELEHIELYMLIQKKRYDDAVSFRTEVDPQVLECPVAKLILQPLVENAITHGLEPKGGRGRIEVRVYKDADAVVYEVIDDGVGMDPSILHAPNRPRRERGRGLGLQNIQDRIQLSCGPAFGLEIDSVPGEGTCVKVRQPYRIGREDDDVQNDDRG